MGAILGTVPGWQKTSGIGEVPRTYQAPGFYKPIIPLRRLKEEERWEYYVEFTVKVYLCDSADLENPIVIRYIGTDDSPIKIREIRPDQYPGGVQAWEDYITTKEAEELLTRSNTEVAGLVPCTKGYDIEIITPATEKPPIEKEKPLIPKREMDMIEYIQDLIKASSDPDEIMEYQRQIDIILSRYRLK